ncbi:MAG: PIN domain-containing protein [Chloroflexota bacterium]
MTRVIRLLGAALGLLVALSFVAGDTGIFGQGAYAGALIALWLVAWLVVGFAVLPYLTVVPAAWLVRWVQELSTAEFVTAVLGLVLGLVMGLLLGFPMAAFPAPYGTWLPVGVSITLGLGMAGLTVAKRHDLIGAAEAIGLFRRRGEEAAAPRRGEPHAVVDTSAIIDGRIADIAEAGFLQGTLVVPRVVLEELQRIADSPDAMRRARGRRGLEIVARLQKEDRVPVEIADETHPEIPEVDAKLVAMARARSGIILTNDFNLNRVAEIQGLRVMNVNSLANAMKPAVLPGEELRVRVIQEGKEAGQGVGFLDDGTMIVVEGGARHLDHEIGVVVTRVLQTIAGRMIFAQPRGE